MNPDHASGDLLPTGQSWHDDDLVLISALEHWSYCPRQCGLIYLEQTFDDNIYTMRGSRVHKTAHDEAETVVDGLRVSRGLPLWSDQLGLVGKADIVEWPEGRPFPVEYKSGKVHPAQHEKLQLCAQAMCLEEMLAVPVPAGAIFFHGSRKRQTVVFTERDRADVRDATIAIRALLAGTRLPAAVNDPRCPNCSLVDACQPALATNPARIRGFYSELFHPEGM